MDEPEKQPLLFAHRAIDRYAKAHLGKDVHLNLQDYRVIRVSFRAIGGSWEALSRGDSGHLLKLVAVVKAWGKHSPQPPQ